MHVLDEVHALLVSVLVELLAHEGSDGMAGLCTLLSSGSWTVQARAARDSVRTDSDDSQVVNGAPDRATLPHSSFVHTFRMRSWAHLLKLLQHLWKKHASCCATHCHTSALCLTNDSTSMRLPCKDRAVKDMSHGRVAWHMC